MNKLKVIGPVVIGLSALMLSTQSQAEGRVFGNVGIEDAPWNILIGYNDYGRYDREPRRVEHHHYHHKPRHHYRDDRRHGHGYGHRKHDRHHDRYSRYNRRH